MISASDFIFEILPDGKEYGFSRKPESISAELERRVQRLAASFQWDASAVVKGELQAVAVDCGLPILVSRITRVRNDAYGRLCLRMEIWTAFAIESALALIHQIWSTSVLGESRKEFLASLHSMVCGDSDSRGVIFGPAGTFVAHDFDRLIAEPVLKVSSVEIRSAPVEGVQPIPQSAGFLARKSPLFLSALLGSVLVNCWMLFEKVVATQRMGVLVQERVTAVNAFEHQRTESARLQYELNALVQELRSWRSISDSESPQALRQRLQQSADAWHAASGVTTPEALVGRITALQESAAADPERIDRQRLQALELLFEEVDSFMEGDGTLDSISKSLEAARLPVTQETRSEGSAARPSTRVWFDVPFWRGAK